MHGVGASMTKWADQVDSSTAAAVSDDAYHIKLSEVQQS
jgi:hypothetical protein